MTLLSPDRLAAAYQTALAALLAERNAEGYWTGELSSSALATATAISALALVQKHSAPPGRFDSHILAGLGWLIEHQNTDGGFGDTVKSKSNISTSMLVRAALYLNVPLAYAPSLPNSDCLRRLEAYLHQHCGQDPAAQAEAIRARYGKDRTFAVPILTTCALAGLVPWREVTPLPFELACLPQSWFRFLRLPVVSYALPALIAVGQAIYHHRPPGNPLTRCLRRLALCKSLRVLEAIQPQSGGFLEAIPLTSFVTMSLASIGQAEHPVARKGVEFLVNSMRPDGSWAIDSNLSVWVTTLAINALAAAGELDRLENREELRDWLLAQQFTQRHPYTGADPGGWGWTHLSGSVPDADDTAGALLALVNLNYPESPPDRSDYMSYNRYTSGYLGPGSGRCWLHCLQNRDGGWPTFCRGWGKLPFDRSGSDLTAHVLRGYLAWSWRIVDRGTLWNHFLEWYQGGPFREDNIYYNYGFAARALDYLSRQQRPDGSWLPLWFGNELAPNEENPTYGTTRVLAAYRDLDMMNTEPARRGVAWLLSAQNADGGWGGAGGVPASIEETALAVEFLLDAGPEAEAAVNKGLAWLVDQVEAGGLKNPAPIGFYFAKLWYFEKLYPIIFSVAALGRALRK